MVYGGRSGLDIMRWVEKPYGKATFVEMMVQKW